MEKITKLQTIYLQKVCFLLFLQMVLLLVVVWFVHRFFPDTLCFLTCDKWLDFFLFVLIAFFLIYMSHNAHSKISRYVAFFSIAVLMAYLFSLQYNIISILDHNDREVANRFFSALLLVVILLIINLLLLPFTLGHLGMIYAISSALFVCLVGLIVWGLLIQKGFLLWVSVSLIVFMGLLITDLTILVSRCKKAGSVGCDPLEGASLLYVDLINLLQQIFVLLNVENH